MRMHRRNVTEQKIDRGRRFRPIISRIEHFIKEKVKISEPATVLMSRLNRIPVFATHAH